MNDYSGLNRAQLSYEYLHTNSTTHEFLFGAVAELLDNARDANATKMEVYTVPDESLRGGYMLCFLDNGEGMDPNEANGIITFGRSNKRVMDSTMIGQYGNGLKSGAMRIASDFILFTKKNETMSCVFLSRTFHEEENLQEVIVPLPSFDAKTHKPHCCNTAAAKYRYTAEMNLIFKYSPFKTQEEFMSQFDKISGNKGTLVIVYNMKLLDVGETELLSNPATSDIVLNTTDEERLSLMPEKWSFRAYASVLYSLPYMKIYIEGKKVRTKLFHHSLYMPRLYKYYSTRFKERSKKEAAKANHDALVADMRAKEAESKARQLEKNVFKSSDKNARLNLRKAQDVADELREDATLKKSFAKKKQKDEKQPKILDFIFGLNLERRTHDGLFIYNCSRLIKMYEKVGPQMEGGLNCSGVVGIVDVPYQVLEPTHNKQDFADAKEYRHLLKTLGEHMQQYWQDIQIAKQGVTKFWENYGYTSNNWQHAPANETKFLRKRAIDTDFYLQCDNCLKWRIIPFSSTNISRSFEDKWICSMNSDHSHNRCNAPEQKSNITEGTYVKETKTNVVVEELKRDGPKSGVSRRSSLYARAKISNTIKSVPRVAPPKVTTPPRRSRAKLTPRKRIECDTSYDKMEKSEEDTEEEESQVTKISRVKTKRGLAGKLNRLKYKESEESDDGQEIVDNSRNRSTLKRGTGGVSHVDTVQATSTSSPQRDNSFNEQPKLKRNRENQQDNHDDDSDQVETAKESAHSTENYVLEVPSSSTPIVPSANNNSITTTTLNDKQLPDQQEKDGKQSDSLLDDVSKSYRNCLRYFLPPNWTLKKEEISGLSPNDLAKFPLSDFVDHYESGIKKIMENFQTEVEKQKKSAELHENEKLVAEKDLRDCKKKLTNLRRMVGELLKSTNRNVNIKIEDDGGENIEKLLLESLSKHG